MLLNFLKLVRYQNILLIILTQFLIKYFLFVPLNIPITLSNFGFILLMLATISIAMAGNIINDLNDRETDEVNKPGENKIGNEISVSNAQTLFIVLNVIGVTIGFYLSNLINKPGFSALFIIISALLYLYAIYLKQLLIIGNLVVSFLVGMVILIIGLYDLFPTITPQNQQTQAIIFSILLDYAIFAFLINWLREMVKDQQDVKGDYKTGRNSLPIALGQQRANKIIFIVGIIPVLAIVHYIYQYLFHQIYAVLYALLLLVAPLLYFLIHIWNAKTDKEFKNLSILLKFIMLFGILSIAFYPFILL